MPDFSKYDTDEFGNKLHDKLPSSSDIRAGYINVIAEMMGTPKEDILYILDEIHTLCELIKILEAISSNIGLNALRKKDKNHEHRKKDNFTTKRDKFVEECLKIGLKDEAQKIKKIMYEPSEYYMPFEDNLKYHKHELFNDLTKECKTGEKRAKELTKLLEIQHNTAD